jgi:hypothetical protein
VHCGIGPSLLLGRSCAGAQNRPQVITRALKKGYQMADDAVGHLLEVGHFTVKCLKFNTSWKTIMAPCKVVYKDMQKRKAKQPKITTFFGFPFVMRCVSFGHSDNFQPEKPTFFQ